jgi:hypothetical protein
VFGQFSPPDDADGFSLWNSCFAANFQTLCKPFSAIQECNYVRKSFSVIQECNYVQNFVLGFTMLCIDVSFFDGINIFTSQEMCSFFFSFQVFGFCWILCQVVNPILVMWI